MTKEELREGLREEGERSRRYMQMLEDLRDTVNRALDGNIGHTQRLDEHGGRLDGHDAAIGAIDVREQVLTDYNAAIQERLPGTVWNSGGCSSWYIDANGVNSTIWPGFTWPYRQRTRHFDPGPYALTKRTAVPASV